MQDGIIKVILVVASQGYQSIEYSVPKRILEHSGIQVLTASDQAGIAHATDGTTTKVDIVLNQVKTNEYDGIFFIGGAGSIDCLDNDISYSVLQEAYKAKKIIGGICLAVRILSNSGILQGKRATGWNGDNQLEDILKKGQAIYIKNDVVVDKNIITATDPDAAQTFGAAILNSLGRMR